MLRANQNRALLGEDGKPLRKNEADTEIIHLFEQARQGRELGTHQLEVKAAGQNKIVKGTRVLTQWEARLVGRRIRVCEGTPRPPYRKGGKLNPVIITVVLAEEIEPPPGQEPITWLLLTSRKVENRPARQRAPGYACRYACGAPQSHQKLHRPEFPERSA